MTIQYNKLEVSIALGNLQHNYRLYRKLCDNVIPVIKSDAYGHGLVEVAATLAQEGATTFAVGFVNEAVTLRRSGCDARIFALLGPVDAGDMASLWDHDILAAFAHWEQLELAAHVAEERGPLKFCLKIDSGMRRLGFRPEEMDELVSFLEDNPLLQPVMATSHLASADIPDHKANVELQIERFTGAVDALREAGFEIEANIANSAGSLAFEQCRMDSLRQGITLYGGNPFHGTEKAALGADFKPAMSVSAPVMQVHPLSKGEGISYGWTHVADKDCHVAVIGVGYADGYSRSLSGTGEMTLHGRRVPILGRVCMQMTLVDVSALIGDGLSVQPGDRAWLLGGPGPDPVTPEELAGWWDTISYEAFCLLGLNPRQYL